MNAPAKAVRSRPTQSAEAPAAPVLRAGRHGPSVGVFVLAAALTLAGDLALKAWSFACVAPAPVTLTPDAATDPVFWRQHAHDVRIVIPGVLGLHLTTNTGAVFGMGRGGRGFFIAVSILTAIIIPRLFYVSRRGDYLLHLALGLVLGGALGNLYDRVRFHAVRDMLYLFPGVKLPWGLSWPGGSREVYPWIFNLADAALLVGIVLIVLLAWRKPRALDEPQMSTAREQMEPRMNADGRDQRRK